MLNLDNAESRRAVEHCYRTTTTMVNPIIDWTDEDVWTFLKHYGCKGNPLYQCGEDRIGCIGCPLSGIRQQKNDFKKYPKYKANYIRAFTKMVDERRKSGLKTDWKDGKDVFSWWLGENPNQLSFFDDEEIEQIMTDMGL